VTNLVTTELIVAAITLAVAGVIGAVLVRRELEPLERVATTARRVTALPLDRGEVELADRVPDADPATEVGQVGAALNHMLDHVGAALEAPQDSEMQLRQFVADASHELRTPLAADPRLRRADPPRAALGRRRATRSSRISSQAERMTTLVEDLLLLARLDAGRPLERTDVDLTRLVLDAVSDAHAAGPDHRWQLDLPDEPVTVTGDPSRLTQVLTNLLANARTHTPPGTDRHRHAGRRIGHRTRGGGRRGPGHPERPVAPHLRTVRARLLVAVPAGREHGARPRDRVGCGRGARRRRERDEQARPHRVRGAAADGAGSRSQLRHRPSTTSAQRTRPRSGHVTATLPSIVPSATTDPSPCADGTPPSPARRLGVLLVATATLYLWGLSASGWANGFYSAAAQAAGVSGRPGSSARPTRRTGSPSTRRPRRCGSTASRYGSSGLSSWSVLAPQAVVGVATVALLYASVRRTALTAGLACPARHRSPRCFAGAALAVTPVAVLIFRFNNPDALLTLLLVGAAYATLRAVERGGTRWLLLAATLVGFGFLTKMLQAFLVLPALAAVWLLAAPVGWGRRLRDLALAAVALVVSAGWWVLVVELWPAADRPYIGGSQDNSVLELVFGYNGFGRLTGDEVGSVGGSPGGGWGSTGAGAAVRVRVRRAGGVAAARGAAGARRAALVDATGPARRRAAGRGGGVGRVAGGHRPDVQPDGRDHPPVLRGGACAADRRARRARRGGGVAGPGPAGGPAAPGGRPWR
jgi:hypothetical protein